MLGSPSLVHKHEDKWDQNMTLKPIIYTLSKSYDQMMGESTYIVNKGIHPRTKCSLYDSDTWTITIWFQVEISHHNGLGEQ